MNKNYLLLLFALLLVFTGRVSAQGDPLLQLSGVVVTGDSLKPVPFVNVMIRHTYRGTYSDYYGFFSLVASRGDTIEFSSVGYKKGRFIIPDTLGENRYSLIEMLSNDTILLQEAVIYPWPTRDQFKQAFLDLQLPADDLDRAKYNITMAERKERNDPMPMDGSMNYRNAMAQQQGKLYYAGQLPPNNLLNPIAWSKFIRAWRNGDFKRKEDTDE
jgi:hypothetical protein